MLFALPMGMAATQDTEAVREMVTRALQRAGIAQKEAAILMGLSEPHFNRQLSGNGYVALARLLRLPPLFWFELLSGLGEHLGLWSTAAWREQALEAMATKLTMARAGLPSRTLGQAKEGVGA